MLDQLEQLESSYYSENSLNYNPDVFRFLENYGLNQNQLKGEAIQNLIDECSKVVNGSVRMRLFKGNIIHLSIKRKWQFLIRWK